MASRATSEKWLAELTNIPTASAKEMAVSAVDAGDPLREGLDKVYESQARYLD